MQSIFWLVMQLFEHKYAVNELWKACFMEKSIRHGIYLLRCRTNSTACNMVYPGDTASGLLGMMSKHRLSYSHVFIYSLKLLLLPTYVSMIKLQTVT